MLRVVKSSQGINFNGVVPLDNTVVVKKQVPKKTISEDESIEDYNKQIIEIEVQNRLASKERELSEKENDAFNRLNIERSKIISQAMLQADKIKNDASIEANALKDKAKEQGYNEGFEKGKEEAQQKATDYLKTAAQVFVEINNAKQNLYNSMEQDLIALAVEMAEKIVSREIIIDSETVLSIARQAAKNFRTSSYIKISLAKCDISQNVIGDERVLRSIADNIPDVELELLPDAESGTVLIDNDKEIIDASVPTQLDLLREIAKSGNKTIVDSTE